MTVIHDVIANPHWQVSTGAVNDAIYDIMAKYFYDSDFMTLSEGAVSHKLGPTWQLEDESALHSSWYGSTGWSTSTTQCSSGAALRGLRHVRAAAAVLRA